MDNTSAARKDKIMRDFKQLKVWQKAHASTLDIYHMSKDLPEDERFGLTSQLRRAAASMPSNIAEGCGRQTDRELAHFLSIAAGSASEVEYQLLLVKDLGYISGERHRMLDEQINEIKRMLNSFIKKVSAAND
jgi:four helix bundle protein